MYGMSVAAIKRGKPHCSVRAFPRPETKTGKIYQALLRDGLYVIQNPVERSILAALHRDYGIQTRSTGKGKYILVSTG